jgi:hypothetical protein
MLRRLFNRAADSFDQVRSMVTRKLPIPDLEGTTKYVQFHAKRDKQGFWTISSKHNATQVTQGFQTVSKTFQAAAQKHIGRNIEHSEDVRMNFDTAFLILKDMEESLLKYKGTVAGPEPSHHFMAAYRLLPKQFREGLDDLLAHRTDKKGIILPPKVKPEEVKALPATENKTFQTTALEPTKPEAPKPPKPN